MILILAFGCELIDSSQGMGYGTLMGPVLFLLGFDIFIIIPSILFAEMLTGFSSALFHHEMDNCKLGIKERNLRIVLFVSVLCIIAMIISIIIVLQIPQIFIEIYTGIMVMILGLVLLFRKKAIFSWKKLEIISVIGAFNKAISGGGFGPIITAGQMLSGRNYKESIGTTKAAEFFVSLAGFFTFYIFYGISDYTLLKLLVISGTFATPFGAWGTKSIKSENKAKILIAILAISIGLILLFKIMICGI